MIVGTFPLEGWYGSKKTVSCACHEDGRFAFTRHLHHEAVIGRISVFGRVTYSCMDFIPLLSATATPLAFVSRKDGTRRTDMASFARHLRSQPGGTRYSAGSELSMPHLAAASLLRTMHAPSRHMAFADLHEGTVELRDGNLDWMVVNPAMYPDAKGNFRVLAVIGDSQESTKVYDNAHHTADFRGWVAPCRSTRMRLIP